MVEAAEFTDWITALGQDSTNEYPTYDTKQSDDMTLNYLMVIWH